MDATAPKRRDGQTARGSSPGACHNHRPTAPRTDHRSATTKRLLIIGRPTINMPRKAHALLLFLTSSLLVTLAQTQQMYEPPQANDSIAVPFFNPQAALEGGLRAAAVNNDTAVQTQEVLSVLLSFTNTSAMEATCSQNTKCVSVFPLLAMASFQGSREDIDNLRRTLGPSLLAFVDGDISVSVLMLNGTGSTDDNDDFDYYGEYEYVGMQTTNGIPWGVDRLDGSVDGKAPAEGGRGAHVFVIDSGIDASHPSFAGRLSTSKDFVGDRRGTQDCHGHGTHVAGTAAGTGFGVATQSTLHAVRVLGCMGGGSGSGVIAALEWTLDEVQRLQLENKSVVVLSLGGGRSKALDTAVAKTAAAGVAVVVAAGNEGQDTRMVSPAAEPSAITVGASDVRDKFASFSNHGPGLDVIAPGVSILSAWKGGGSRTQSGTSMAAPHVAGLAALALAQEAMEPAALEARLIASAAKGSLRDVPAGTANRLVEVIGTTTTAPSPSPVPVPVPVPATPNPPSPLPKYDDPCKSFASKKSCESDAALACKWLARRCYATPLTDIIHASPGELRLDPIASRSKARRLGIQLGRMSTLSDSGCETSRDGERLFELVEVRGVAPLGVVDVVIGSTLASASSGVRYPWPKSCSNVDPSLGLQSARAALRVVADPYGKAAVRIRVAACGVEKWIAVEPSACRNTVATALLL